MMNDKIRWITDLNNQIEGLTVSANKIRDDKRNHPRPRSKLLALTRIETRIARLNAELKSIEQRQ